MWNRDKGLAKYSVLAEIGDTKLLFKLEFRLYLSDYPPTVDPPRANSRAGAVGHMAYNKNAFRNRNW
jgi:hypothetical protein